MSEKYNIVVAELILAENRSPSDANFGSFSFAFRLADGQLKAANVTDFHKWNEFDKYAAHRTACNHIQKCLAITPEKLWQNRLSWYVRLAVRESDGKVCAIGHILKPKRWFYVERCDLLVDPKPVKEFHCAFVPIVCAITKVTIQAMGHGCLRVLFMLDPGYRTDAPAMHWSDFKLEDAGGGIETIMKMCGVNEWHKLPGRFVQFRHELGWGCEIADIFGNYWLNDEGIQTHKSHKRRLLDFV